MLLISTSSLKWYWLHKIFKIAKESNYDWIDLVIENWNFDTFDQEYVKSLSDEFQVPVLSITAPDKWLDKEKIDKIIKMSTFLWSQVVNFSPPHITDKNMDWYLSYLSKLKWDLRISIAIQNIEQKFLYFVIPEYKNSNLLDIKKITWDTALNISNIDKTTWTDLMKMLWVLWSSIKNIYLSDKSWTKDWLVPWCASWWLSHLPLESFFMKLKNSWYNWFFSLKVKSQELWAWNDERVLDSLKLVKNYYKKHFIDFKP